MIAIIGAGASGLVAAIVLARAGLRVHVYEKNPKLGRKILATGNGRCNVTNRNIEVSRYHGIKPSFVNASIHTFTSAVCQKFFAQLGINMLEGQKGRLYPKSLQSSSIVDLLVYECERLGVVFFANSEVQTLRSKADGFVLKVDEKEILASKVLIATGGLAMPSLGSCGSGYAFAEHFGHTIIPTHASLVQLVCDTDMSSLSGVKIEGSIEVLVDNELRASATGDILFANYGISGSAILDVSRTAANALHYGQSVHVMLNLASDYSKEELKGILLKRKKYANGKSVALWLEGFVNSKLARHIGQVLRVANADDLSPKDITRLVFLLQNFKLHVTDTKGYKSAEVTAGGVNVSEINPATLESKLQKNLYFSGEVLDIDADCGGYNLHWAWASGYCAALAMVAKKAKSK